MTERVYRKCRAVTGPFELCSRVFVVESGAWDALHDRCPECREELAGALEAEQVKLKAEYEKQQAAIRAKCDEPPRQPYTTIVGPE
jgi:uncharacterized protein with PIN domain